MISLIKKIAIFLARDNNNKLSRSFLFVTLSCILIIISFTISLFGLIPLINVTDFATSISILVGVLAGREWVVNQAPTKKSDEYTVNKE